MTGFTELMHHVDKTLVVEAMENVMISYHHASTRSDPYRQIQHRQSQVTRTSGSPYSVLPAYYGSVDARPKASPKTIRLHNNPYFNTELSLQAACKGLHDTLLGVSLQVQKWSRDVSESQLESMLKTKKAFAIKVKAFTSQLKSVSTVLRVGRQDWDFNSIPDHVFSCLRPLLETVIEQSRVLQQRSGRIGPLFRSTLWISSMHLKTSLLGLQRQRVLRQRSHGERAAVELAWRMNEAMTIEA